MNRRLLLLSNSRDPDGRFLVHADEQLRELLGSRVERVFFVPYAAVTTSFDEYTSRVRERFRSLGYDVESAHEPDGTTRARHAQAIVVGGGNTFHLLGWLQRTGLVTAIRERVLEGVPYIGWSAGSVVACATIQTTNDMPIVQPETFDALELIPFQINAHYTEFHPAGFQGETRAQRIAEFLAVNPDATVVGLPEGTMLRVERDTVTLHGSAAARVFESSREPRDHPPGASLDFLMRASPSRGRVR